LSWQASGSWIQCPWLHLKMAPNTYGPAIIASTVVTLVCCLTARSPSTQSQFQDDSNSTNQVLATIFVVLRFISRGLILRRLAIDDLFMALAWVFSTGLSTSFIYAVYLGFGDHYATIPTSHDATLMKIAFVFAIIYVSLPIPTGLITY